MSGQVRNRNDNFRIAVSGNSRDIVFCGCIYFDG